MKIKNILFGALLAMSANAMAQDALSANDVNIDAGKTATLEIGLTNTLEYTIATIDLMLPEGITIVYNADEDEYAVELDRWNKKHTATVSEIAGGYRILIMDSSNKNKTIGAGEGTMATITLQASADAKSGTGKIIADGEANGTKTQVFATPDGTQYFLKDVEFAVNVGGETGINNFKADMDNAPVYNLNGQRVEKASNGLFIKNGKKMVVKK